MTEPATTPAAPDPVGFARSRSVHDFAARLTNRVVIVLCYVSALVTITALFIILGYVVYRGATSMNLALFTANPGPPDAQHPTGLRSAIEGTLILVAMASVIGIPLGMLCGIYLAEYAGDTTFAHGIRLVVDVLAGVPSILMGVLAYELVVVPMHGNSAWAGALALGVLMCPIIARTTEEMLKLVPKALREASVGLGGSKFQTLFRVVIPTASAGIITGVMLAVARVAGETAPLLFTVLGYDEDVVSFNGHFPFLHVELNHAFPSLTLKIYQYAASPEPDWTRQAWAGMLVLIVLVLVLNICVRVASNRKKFKAV